MKKHALQRNRCSRLAFERLESRIALTNATGTLDLNGDGTIDWLDGFQDINSEGVYDYDDFLATVFFA